MARLIVMHEDRSGVAWLVMPCPLLANLREEVLAHLGFMREPWQSQTRMCVSVERLSVAHTTAVLAVHRSGALVAFALLGHPDLSMIRNGACSFLHAVWVAPDRRRAGLGAKIVKVICSVAERDGEDSVLLASGDPELRTHLYEPIGFEPFSDDPWLMARRSSPSARGAKRRLRGVGVPRIRGTSCHDLATVQSLCASEHWRVTEGDVQHCQGEEKEEAFCQLFATQGILSVLWSRGFRDGYVIGWYTQPSDGGWELCLSGKLSVEDEALSVAREALAAISGKHVSIWNV